MNNFVNQVHIVAPANPMDGARIFLNGKELKDVKAFSVNALVNEITQVTITLLGHVNTSPLPNA